MNRKSYSKVLTSENTFTGTVYDPLKYNMYVCMVQVVITATISLNVAKQTNQKSPHPLSFILHKRTASYVTDIHTSLCKCVILKRAQAKKTALLNPPFSLCLSKKERKKRKRTQFSLFITFLLSYLCVSGFSFLSRRTRDAPLPAEGVI